VDPYRSGPFDFSAQRTASFFRRRTRSNPCDFSQSFFALLQSSQTVEPYRVRVTPGVGMQRTEWVLLIEQQREDQGIQTLALYAQPVLATFYILSGTPADGK
jgi:hypothetical protein